MTIQDFFHQNPQVAVAFSGGVDSAWLLHESVRFAQRVRAYYVRTPFQPAFELEDAQDTAARLGASLEIIDFDILTVPAVAENPADRCYYCKTALFSHIVAAAKADGFPVVLDGSNASDDADDRPGMRALRELGVRSPLRECGVTKAEIRAFARDAELPVWNKPSYACLATRIPAGTPITLSALERVEQGEAHLMERGFSDFRLRLRGETALLQVRAEQMEQAKSLLNTLREELNGCFASIELDPTPRQPRES